MLIYLGVLDVSWAPDLSALFPSANSDQLLQVLLGPVPAQDKSEIAPPSVDAKAPKEGPVLSNGQAFKLRAAAIDACEMIISQARAFGASRQEEGSGQESLAWIRQITLPELDMWLWSVAKDRPDYRALERFAQRDTVFY
jgi:endonuclease YncB( thermonuclease family)